MHPVTEMDEASEERQGERQQDKCREEKCQVSAGLHYTSASLPVTGLSVVSSPLPQLPINPYPAGRLPWYLRTIYKHTAIITYTG